jgi:hypothetical protein
MGIGAIFDADQIGEEALHSYVGRAYSEISRRSGEAARV